MKKIETNLIMMLWLLTIPQLVLAQDDCSDPNAQMIMDYNNVKALLRTGEMMFYDGFDPIYTVPKAEGVNAVFASNTWMGAMDENDSLHISGSTFSNTGYTFLTGPLTNDGELLPDVCTEYDNIYQVSRQMSEVHAAYFVSLANGTVEVDFPNGYVIPQELVDYPGNGDVTLGLAAQLAPYHDANNDGIYDPTTGDYPLFSGMESVAGCGTCNTLNGNVAYFWIDNDMGMAEGQSTPLGVEIHNTAYCFGTYDDLNNTTFYQKKIINRSGHTYTDFYIGIFSDMDLGGSEDDYVSCDVQRNMGVVYNGDDNDEDIPIGTMGYGLLPPMAAVKFLDSDGDDGEPIMTSFVSFDRLLPFPQTDPATPQEYYNYLTAHWQDGTPITYGNDGYGGAVECSYMLPRDTDPTGIGTGGVVQAPWSEETALNDPTDRRFVMSQGPYTLAPGESICFTYAILYAESPEDGGVNAGFEALNGVADFVQDKYDDCFEGVISGVQDVEAEEIATIAWDMASSQLSVASKMGQSLTLAVYDAMGKKVLVRLIQDQQVMDLSSLAMGSYVIHLLDDAGHSQTTRIAKVE